MVIGHWELGIGNWALGIGHWALQINLLLIFSYLYFTAITDYRLPIPHSPINY
ncbi:hypothetical protein [Microcoleus anatoxicus]|uniref:Uncharacterized protein n=1 Tax=Microcoleus anatoxicus PTRS2 TaxID=2705321 RepID=A0ABU8YPQ0_9CYAN